MLKSWLLLALVACATVVDVSASQVDDVDASVAQHRKLLETAMKVVQEDDKPADGEAEGTGEGEMGITGGMDEEVNSTVVSPDGTKPCEDEMCILETAMPHCFPISAGEEMCEGHGYTAAQCADPTITQGCCEYDEGDDEGCWWSPTANAENAAAVVALSNGTVSPPPPMSGAVHGHAAAALGVALTAAVAAVFAV